MKETRSMYGELAIFSGRANRPLAEEICQYLKVPLRNADIFQFPNQNIFVRLHDSVRSQDVFLIQPTCAAKDDETEKPLSVNDSIMELLIFIDTLRRDSAGRITAVVPYYAYGRTDKKDRPRVPITARLVADMITVAGADRFLTMDLHAGQIQGFFTIPVDDITAFHMLSDYFTKKRVENAVVIAPDVGASKKARNFAQELQVPLAIVEKRRIGKDAEALTLIGEVKDKNAIIFDDEVDTASTLAQAEHLLEKSGAKDIYACVTHPVLSHPALERLRECNLKELVVTNTVPISAEKMLPNITVLSVGPLLAEVIRRIHLGKSVGELFNE